MDSEITAQAIPKNNNSETTREQKLLNLVLLGLAIPGFTFGLAMLVLWFFGRVPLTGVIAGLGVQPFYLLSYWMGKRGWTRIAAYIPVIAVFIAMVGSSYQIGIGHVTYIGYAMATLTAGILIGPGEGVLIAVLSTVAHVIMGMLQISGRLPHAITPQTMVIPDGIGLGLGLLVIIAFISIYGGEISKALEREQDLSQELKTNQTNLERTIANRTHDLSRRLTQIRTAAEISRTIVAILDPEQLLAQVVELMRDRFDLYYVGAFLLDETGQHAMLRAATGEAGEKILAEGHHLAVDGTSMIGWAINHRQPRLALDVGEEAVRFNNPHLPHTRSELVLPLLIGDRVSGALTIQSDVPNAFDQDDLIVLQGIADSLATAMENARLFQEVQSNLEEIKSLHRGYLAEAWGDVLRNSNQLIFNYENELDVRESPDPEKVIKFPITLRDQIIGELTLETDKSNFTPEERLFIEGVINQTALSLENARLLEEAHRLVMREQKISAISNQIHSSIDLETILQDTVRELGIALDSSNTFIQIGLEEKIDLGVTQT